MSEDENNRRRSLFDSVLPYFFRKMKEEVETLLVGKDLSSICVSDGDLIDFLAACFSGGLGAMAGHINMLPDFVIQEQKQKCKKEKTK